HPTLLLDEADCFVPGNEELRGVLNSGHTRGAKVYRCEGDNPPRARGFSTWAPKAIAGIRQLPHTVQDRSIVITMKRKTPDEKIQPIEAHKFGASLEDLRRKAMRWANDNLKALKEEDLARIEGLGDRANDNWRPLLAIARLAGEDWLASARSA